MKSVFLVFSRMKPKKQLAFTFVSYIGYQSEISLGMDGLIISLRRKYI